MTCRERFEAIQDWVTIAWFALYEFGEWLYLDHPWALIVGAGFLGWWIG